MKQNLNASSARTSSTCACPHHTSAPSSSPPRALQAERPQNPQTIRAPPHHITRGDRERRKAQANTTRARLQKKKKSTVLMPGMPEDAPASMAVAPPKRMSRGPCPLVGATTVSEWPHLNPGESSPAPSHPSTSLYAGAGTTHAPVPAVPIPSSASSSPHLQNPSSPPPPPPPQQLGIRGGSNQRERDTRTHTAHGTGNSSSRRGEESRGGWGIWWGPGVRGGFNTVGPRRQPRWVKWGVRFAGVNGGSWQQQLRGGGRTPPPPPPSEERERDEEDEAGVNGRRGRRRRPEGGGGAVAAASSADERSRRVLVGRGL